MTMRFVNYEKGCHPMDLVVSTCDAPTLTEDKVIVKVAAFGINRADTLQRQGRYPAPPGESEILGLEVAGEIVALGDNVSEWNLGDRVFGLVAGGGYAEYVAVEPSHLMPIPQGMDFEQAAGMAEVFLTAFQCLRQIAEVKAGQKVLVHGGASGVGLATIQLCKFFGALVAVTASSDAKLKHCSALGADLVVNYKTQDFAAQCKQKWPAGVDIVIDMVGGEYVNKNLKILSLDSIIINIAMLGGRYADNIDMALLLGKRARIQGTTLRNRTDQYKTSLVNEFSELCLSAFEQNLLKPNIDMVYSIRDVGVAHQRLENNDTVGKLVVQW